MIHYNPKSWFSLIFHTYNRQVIRKLLPAMAAMGVFTAGVCYIELEVLEEPITEVLGGQGGGRDIRGGERRSTS